MVEKLVNKVHSVSPTFSSGEANLRKRHAEQSLRAAWSGERKS